MGRGCVWMARRTVLVGRSSPLFVGFGVEGAVTSPVMYTQKKPIDNTHIVRERDRQRNRELLAVLSLGIPIGLFLLLFTWQNLEVIRLGRETTRLQKICKDTEAAAQSAASRARPPDVVRHRRDASRDARLRSRRIRRRS